jgi:hypothetical protein
MNRLEFDTAKFWKGRTALSNEFSVPIPGRIIGVDFEFGAILLKSDKDGKEIWTSFTSIEFIEDVPNAK